MPATVDADQRELPPAIEGVRLHRLHQHVDHRGALMPILDAAKDLWSDPVVYAYLIVVAPGRIKGWGMHQHQEDRYVVFRGDLRVALHDDRPGSPTRGASASVFFSDRTPGVLTIPPGVWHADQNHGTEEALLVNFPTRAYAPERPDKHHVDVHAGVIPFDFTLRDY